MNDRPTPETDAAWSCFKGYTEPLQDVQDLSCRLERERDEARELYDQASRGRNEMLAEYIRLRNALEDIAGTSACLKDEIGWYELREIAEKALDYKEL